MLPTAARSVATLADLVVGAAERLEQRWRARRGQAAARALRVSTAEGEKTLTLRSTDQGRSRDERSP